MYSFDEAGKLLWPAPVTLDDQVFPIGQLEGLPFMLFAGQRVDYRAQ